MGFGIPSQAEIAKCVNELIKDSILLLHIFVVALNKLLR